MFTFVGIPNLRLFSLKNLISTDLITLRLKICEENSDVSLFRVLKGLLSTSTSIVDLITQQSTSRVNFYLKKCTNYENNISSIYFVPIHFRVK